jgi:lipoprotein-anchoring transpeptidase ErfK/SrfK
LRATVSLVVIGFALAISVGGAAAQYIPPQPAPFGYPPPAYYAYPTGSPQHPGVYPDSGAERTPYRASPKRDPDEDFYSDAEPSDPPAFDIYRASPERYPDGYPDSGAEAPDDGTTVAVPDDGTTVAALPPEFQPERGPATDLPPRFHRSVVDYPTTEPPGTIIVDTPNTYLYLTLGQGKAIRYGIGVGREGFTWSGTERISRMKEWPDWLPPKEMIKRQPYLPRFMAGGETNPLGARAMYLGNTQYRIHGTNQPSTIGTFVSSGCIRLTNEDVEDLYRRATIGTTVVVLPGPNTAAWQLRSRL